MAKTVRKTGGSSGESPAITIEGRENQLISLAVDAAEKQLREGTASSQIITTLLKYATSQAKLEKEILELQKELIKAKTENLKASQYRDELYKEAIAAMREYGGYEDADFND